MNGCRRLFSFQLFSTGRPFSTLTFISMGARGSAAAGRFFGIARLRKMGTPVSPTEETAAGVSLQDLF